MLRRLVAWLRRALLGGGAPSPTAPALPARPPPRRRARRPADDDDDVVVVPIEDSIDLHTFAPRDVASVTAEYLREAARLGFAEVRVVHGRGKGVQRRVVRSVLARHADVVDFRDAPATRGGWGAQVVTLRPAPKPRSRRSS